jgi:hypothetical protein
MDDRPEADMSSQDVKSAQRGIIITVILLIVLGLALVGAAILLASNPQNTGPGVRIVRDLLIIVMALEVIVIGAAFALFLIQLARLVNLIHNEVEPLIEAASDTVNTVRGTAVFLSKNLVEPVTTVSSTIRGVSKVVGDVDAIRKAAGVVMGAASVPPPTGPAYGAVPSTSDLAPHRTGIARQKPKPRKQTARKTTNSRRKSQEED